MEFITAVEATQWLSRINLSVGFEERFSHSARYAVPADTGRKTALGRRLALFFVQTKGGLLLITGSGIWPSSENPDLFLGYRRGLGEIRSLHEIPGHIYGREDGRYLECLIDIVLYFYWDAILVSSEGEIACQFSHDEVLTLKAQALSLFQELTDEVAQIAKE